MKAKTRIIKPQDVSCMMVETINKVWWNNEINSGTDKIEIMHYRSLMQTTESLLEHQPFSFLSQILRHSTDKFSPPSEFAWRNAQWWLLIWILTPYRNFIISIRWTFVHWTTRAKVSKTTIASTCWSPVAQNWVLNFSISLTWNYFSL